MKQVLITILICCSGIRAGAQDTAQIYAFINQLYGSVPSAGTFRLDVFKSDWGNFILSRPYVIDLDFHSKIMGLSSSGMDTTTSPIELPQKVTGELFSKWMALDTEWQQRFRWQQNKIQKYLVVENTKATVSAAALGKLRLNTREKTVAQQHIKDWNKSAEADRLVNYCSIPVFTDDGQYALIVIGQDVRSEGGWDSIFFFKKTGNRWEVAKTTRLSEI